MSDPVLSNGVTDMMIAASRALTAQVQAFVDGRAAALDSASASGAETQLATQPAIQRLCDQLKASPRLEDFLVLRFGMFNDITGATVSILRSQSPEKQITCYHFVLSVVLLMLKGDTEDSDFHGPFPYDAPMQADAWVDDFLVTIFRQMARGLEAGRAAASRAMAMAASR